MKYMSEKTYKPVSRLVLFIMLLSLMVSAKAQEPCIKVDLQCVSIDPLPATIKKGQTTSIILAMKNNGPCMIPKGDATAQVTLIGEYLELGTPLNFIDICGQWTYLGVISKDGQHNLFFQNNEGPIPVNGQPCYFQFDVKGKAETPVISPTGISMVSSLSITATTADMNGRNQAAWTEVKIIAAAIPIVLADFNATVDSCKAVLNWKTEAQKNLSSFEVEYSTDGNQFIKVGTVQAKNTATGSTYSFINDQATAKAYYRLKMIEKGGNSSNSKIVLIDTKCAPKKGFAP